MQKKDYGSTTNCYYEIKEDPYYEKQTEWDMAIGLQLVDGLKPSKYLEQLSLDNIYEKITIKEVREHLKDYYNNKDKINNEELECDFVSTRIVELLNDKDFELSISYLKHIHKYLFQDVYEFAGKFRKVDISKKEEILNNDTVAYTKFDYIQQSLLYDIEQESKKNYQLTGISSLITGITGFSSNLWQIHPFREGNTRTVAIFIQKYLISLNYHVDNELFKNNSKYYRDALVRSCYTNYEKNIKEDKQYLIEFYKNLLLGKRNHLEIDDLIIKELF